jgi:hypothetical protein
MGKSRASEAASIGDHRYFLGMKSRPNRREKSSNQLVTKAKPPPRSNPIRMLKFQGA